MKQTRYVLTAIILTVILGLFLIFSTITSRRTMLDLIKDEARSMLSLVALVQENSIFGEAMLEDQVIDKLIDVVNYCEETGLSRSRLDDLRHAFGLNSITVFSEQDGKLLIKSGSPFNLSDTVYKGSGNIFYEYFLVRENKYTRFIYKTNHRIYQVELSAEDIKQFNQEFGINRILNQISVNPLIRYLALQDSKGIIFATPNVKTLSKIEGDSLLMSVLNGKKEVTRIAMFDERNVLELAQPFMVDDKVVGIFRIGISLDSYDQHTRKTLLELAAVFVTLFMLGFFLLFMFVKYQNYRDLEELFSRTLGAIEEGVMLLDKKGTITGVNHRFCAISGMEERAVMHASYLAVFSQQDIFSINYVTNNKTRIEEEKDLFGGKRIQYASYPLLNRAGVVTGIIIIIRDVTKIRAFEKEQKESERLSFLGNLVANFAHEIKNPLNGLSIASQRLVREFPQKNPDYQLLTGTLLKEINALNQVLNDFLGLVRPHVKREEVFDLGLVIKDSANVVREQARERGYKFTEQIASNLKMTGHPDDLKRAVLNIMVNSIDALSGLTGRPGEINIEFSQDKDKLILVIQDNGPGINKEEQDKIFTPYFTTKKGGTGLGLYIAQRIIYDHEGTIIVESQKGSGTKFTITFPARFSS
ncbi:MAG TPA: ATP-binding protein [bacterium]